MSCPICQKKTDPTYGLFCSRRCADVDLGRWLNGTYAVASSDPEDLENAAEALARTPSSESHGPH
ncbi:DNA gyrase inhibitor YacG [Aliiroseovarius sp. S2029]|uniref:DNA gyrase inhibitor YacG n=1 Tax=Aliiroseovarius sp. S2029 TaxID=2936988 RepID=UPI00209B55A0|nr:DNA gyrase inhibitor YacG [Aliiroseovarius sp. S2029]MCK8483757.1 DNA gyrase inhibitor YacG [Aliiroseovarius sp. S2029]